MDIQSSGGGGSGGLSESEIRAIINDVIVGSNSGYDLVTTSEVQSLINAAVAALVDSSPAALDTLNELAAALGDDPNFATTVTNALAGKSNVGHTHTASDITDFNEAAQDAVGGILTDTSEIDFTYDDAGNTISATLRDNSAALARLVNASARSIIAASAAGPWAQLNVSADIYSLFGYANNAAILSGIGADAKYVDVAGDTMTGNLTMSAARITINTDSASGTPFTCSQDSSASSVASFQTYSNDVTAPQFVAQKARGTRASPTVISANDQTFSFTSRAYDGSTFRSTSIQRTTVVAATPSSTDLESRETIFLNPAGSVTQTEFARSQYSVGFSMYGANVVIDNNRHFRLRSYTVATLPSASTATGQVIYCTDLGGTTNGGFLVSNGTIWQREAMGYETHGDSDLTWAYLSNAHTVEFTTTLTADRTVTLGNTVAPRKGIAVRVTRSALGAFNLIIKDDAGTTLLTMTGATARSADFTYSGSHFRLSQDSTL